MSEDQTIESNEQQDNAEAGQPREDQMVMCYVSKRMVPMSQTVEVVYSQTTKYRVLPEFVRY